LPARSHRCDFLPAKPRTGLGYPKGIRFGLALEVGGIKALGGGAKGQSQTQRQTSELVINFLQHKIVGNKGALFLGGDRLMLVSVNALANRLKRKPARRSGPVADSTK